MKLYFLLLHKPVLKAVITKRHSLPVVANTRYLEVVDDPSSLEMFKTRLDGALRKLIWGKRSLPN